MYTGLAFLTVDINMKWSAHDSLLTIITRTQILKSTQVSEAVASTMTKARIVGPMSLSLSGWKVWSVGVFSGVGPSMSNLVAEMMSRSI